VVNIRAVYGRWQRVVQGASNTAHAPSHAVFPAVTADGRVRVSRDTGRARVDFAQLDEPISYSSLDKIFQRAVVGSGVLSNRVGKFTMHCTRRGGAQHRFMYAETLWGLAPLKWWAGWASGEEVSCALNPLHR
jgi:hypothetical protein